MLEVAPVVERASIDEMYLDLTGCESLYLNDLPGYMKKLQEMIKAEFQLPCTIALASNKLVAKIAANTVKPAGVIYVPLGTEKEFLAPLPIGVIPGVGKKTEEFLTQKGLKIVADLQNVPLKELIKLLGAHGEWIHRASNGDGSTTLETEHIAKNISREETFEKDISDIEELEKILFTLTESVCSTLRLKSLSARTVQLKLRNSKFETITRRHTIKPTNYDPDIFNAVKQLLHGAHDGKTPIRLIGVGLSNFTDDAETDLDLFPASEKQQKVLQAVDKLREKFGDDTIKIGGSA